MKAPLVCDYFRTHSFADLLCDHGVKASIGTRPWKASLNYDQIAAKETDALANECRGLVLASPDGAPLPAEGAVGRTIVLARAFDRFFNHGTGHAHALALEHPDTRVFEKLDGTLCIVYFDRIVDEWCVATRSVPDADVPLSGMALSGEGAWTFRRLFEHALRETYGLTFDTFTSKLGTDATYCYELTTPWNQVVVRHDESRIHLLAVRHRDNGEICPHALANHPLPLVPLHPVRTIGDMLALVDARAPNESEGVVVRMTGPDGFRRVKVKSAAYMAATRLKDSVGSSPRSMLEVVLTGHDDDVAAMLPKPLQEELRRIREACAVIEREHEDGWPAIAAAAETNPANPRKAVALAAQASSLIMPFVMERYTGKASSFRDWIDRQRRDNTWTDSFLDGLLERMRTIDRARAA